jgi:hypothetical protein
MEDKNFQQYITVGYRPYMGGEYWNGEGAASEEVCQNGARQRCQRKQGVDPRTSAWWITTWLLVVW